MYRDEGWKGWVYMGQCVVFFFFFFGDLVVRGVGVVADGGREGWFVVGWGDLVGALWRLGSSEFVGEWTAWGRCCGVGESDG
jgi:hypothetical protein